jgi:hypothetical protein
MPWFLPGLGPMGVKVGDSEVVVVTYFVSLGKVGHRLSASSENLLERPTASIFLSLLEGHQDL